MIVFFSRQMSLWLQVTEMELPTLSLMKALMASPARDNIVPTIAFVANGGFT